VSARLYKGEWSGAERERTVSVTGNEFHNQPLLELRRPEVRAELAEALATLDAELPLRPRVMVGGRGDGGVEVASIDPCDPSREVARLRWATEDEAARALELALGSDWPQRDVEERALTLERAAALAAERRLRLAALIVREAGKPWEDADAEVCEAIDFMRFYAASARELDEPLEQVPGERNELRLRPRGPAAVISPWNFPLSIPCGMVTAALVMGSPVLFKPAEQSPACGWSLAELLLEAGVDADALALLPGGAELGSRLVAEPRIATIAFTGSVAVGLEIHRRAHASEGQRQIKRIVAELGGKNCVLVDSDVDLDEAVPAIVRSAYGYAGQKCSAAARALVHEGIAERLADRLAGAVELLRVGAAEDFATEVPALIDADAVAKYRRYAELCRGAELASAPAPGGEQFVSPLLVDADRLPEESPVVREEIFGPLLTIERVNDLDEATDRVRELPQALTAGIFCCQPDRIEHLIERLPAGVVYVDRAITGAMVGRQPFGGNGLSGTGARAGGRTYLRHFADEQVVSTNTVRHGVVL
jgi:RHH-type proline utilization regulon transcriptional repressor/proline dehydrogenase/delta 1-pyrroline-5-carboxylate dehydrogenase